jgi:nitrite reductase/ring-hydroxylating ferredoxin subunit
MLRADVSPQTQADSKPLSRREFLYYLLGASAAVASAGTCAGLYWFTQLRLEDSKNLSEINLNYLHYAATKPWPLQGKFFYLVVSERGAVVFDAICPWREDSLVRWSEDVYRFECPSCGSGYNIEGEVISGPTQRGLDRRVIYVSTRSGTYSTPADGSPVMVNEATSIFMDLHDEIRGLPRSELRCRSSNCQIPRVNTST